MHFTSPLKSNSTKIMLLGSGELGKEVAIEASRLGLEIIAVDRYANAPAHLIANRSYVCNMRSAEELLEIIRREKPDYILPEIEAISIEALFEAEKLGLTVIPNAEAVNKTMNRKNIRRFAAEELGLQTSAYRFVSTLEALRDAAEALGYPCVIKPVMSSSGHGQSIARSPSDIEAAWQAAKGARGDASELIVEAFVPFEYEITLLTIRNGRTTTFCEPIGHIQKDGDYIFSWQPMAMSEAAKAKACEIAQAITDGLGGRGIFGVELFVRGDEVYFSEVSPRPHDTGMVTLITQSQSEFALHVRAVLGLDCGFVFYGEGVSAAYKAPDDSVTPQFDVPEALFGEGHFMRFFGKPEAHPGRRMGVLLLFGAVAPMLEKAKTLIGSITQKG